ncbi:MAG: nucleoside hydrolase [Opitutales bacterium]|nr:nucleoside hydrolase [Opitutales bacterium]
MKKIILTLSCSIFALSVQHANEPVAIIYDTDIGNDVDDVMALGMIHAMESRGHCELLAVTITKDHPLAAAFTDAVNTFYGRPDIPIATVRNGATQHAGRFNGLAGEKLTDGSLRYPHDLKSGNDAPEATTFLRELLASRKDQSVVLVQVGFFTNFRRLLESKPDDISPLSGKELIAKKVKLLSIMGGSFQTIRDSNHYLEYNVRLDIPSAQVLAEQWPTEIIWSGFEIGIAATYPASSIETDYEYTTHHPVREAYYLYNPPPHNRPTWDLTSVLHAVWPNHGYFDLSTPGKVTVEDDGFTRFNPEENGEHRFLKINEHQIIRLREAFVQLCSQPPLTK